MKNKEQRVIENLIKYFNKNLEKVSYTFSRGFMLQLDNPVYNEHFVMYRSLEDQYEVCIGNTILIPDRDNQMFIDVIITKVRELKMFGSADYKESRRDDLLKLTERLLDEHPTT